MAGTKRAPDSEGPTTRSSKSAKTGAASTPGKAKKGGKAPLPTSTFKAKALPLHVNVTHTPPSIPDENSEPAAPNDPGFIGSLALQPNSFSTGSYGWKGSKRITVELQNDIGEKEKVQVMLTINATVLGSKQAKLEGEEDGGEKEADNGSAQEPAGDKAEEEQAEEEPATQD